MWVPRNKIHGLLGKIDEQQCAYKDHSLSSSSNKQDIPPLLSSLPNTILELFLCLSLPASFLHKHTHTHDHSTIISKHVLSRRKQTFGFYRLPQQEVEAAWDFGCNDWKVNIFVRDLSCSVPPVIRHVHVHK